MSQDFMSHLNLIKIQIYFRFCCLHPKSSWFCSCHTKFQVWIWSSISIKEREVIIGQGLYFIRDTKKQKHLYKSVIYIWFYASKEWFQWQNCLQAFHTKWTTIANYNRKSKVTGMCLQFSLHGQHKKKGLKV